SYQDRNHPDPVLSVRDNGCKTCPHQWSNPVANRIEHRPLEAACPQAVLQSSFLRVRREGTPAPLFISFVLLPLKRCKDNAALRRFRAEPKPYERSRGAQFRDNAVATDGRAFLRSLSGGPCAPTLHRTME